MPDRVRFESFHSSYPPSQIVVPRTCPEFYSQFIVRYSAKSKASLELSTSQRLDCLHCLRRELQIKAGQVLLHVLGVGRTCKRQNADLAGETENNLGWTEIGAGR